MKKLCVGALTCASLFSCATFESLSPNGAYADLTKGIWVAKSSSFMGIRTASQSVLYCRAIDPQKPVCVAATGDVGAEKTGGEVK